MSQTWTADELRSIGQAHELRIAPARTDGSWRTARPIWVVDVGAEIYVRTWYRRDTGWFGQVLRHPVARIDVPGLTKEVGVIDVGLGSDQLRADIDAAYGAKYRADSGMISDAAAVTTLRLIPRR